MLQKSIRPASLVVRESRNYGQEKFAIAEGAVNANDIVALHGTSQSHASAAQADADDVQLSRAVLMVAMHGGVAGDLIRLSEMTVVADVNTGGSSINAPVFLSSVAGGWTLTRPTGAAVPRIVGRVLFVNAATGVIVLAPNAAAQQDQVDAGSVTSPAFGNTTGGIPFIFMENLADVGGQTDTDRVMDYQIRILDVWAIKTALAGGGAAASIQVLEGANAITNAISLNVADQTVVRAGTIDDAENVVPAAATLRYRQQGDGGTDSSCLVFVLAVRA